MNYQLINGEVLSKEKALIPLSDLGLLRGYSVFDFFRVVKGIPIFLEDHLERLFASMARIAIRPVWSREDIEEMCYSLIAANGVDRAGMRIIVTGGFSADGFTPVQPNIYMTLQPLPDYPDTDYTVGRKVITSQYLRDMPEIKTTGYAHILQLRDRVRESNAVEVLYHYSGVISECSRSNIFFMDGDGVLHTATSNLLRGVTRSKVIDLATSLGHDVLEEDLTLDEARNMREAFITSSTKGIMPIVSIDDDAIGNGSVGPVTGQLRDRFNALVEDYISSHKQKDSAKA